MLILPTVRQLKYFVALAETLSFSKAAENCYVTQSTLSASIRDLEDILGQTLFERSSRQVLLTREGALFLDKATAILEELQGLVLSMSKSSAPLSGKLRLGIIPTIAPFIIPELLLNLRKDYPALDLAIEEAQTYEILERLDKGSIDLALIALPYETAHYETFTIGEDPFFLAIKAEKAQNSNKRTIKADDLDHHNILLLEDGHCLKDHVLQSCQLGSYGQNQNLRITSLDTLIRMVEKGLGETLVPAMAVKAQYYNKTNVTFLPLEDKPTPPQRKIALVWRKSGVQSQDFKLLGEAIKNVLL